MKNLVLVALGFWLGALLTGAFALALWKRQPAPAARPANSNGPTRFERPKPPLVRLARVANPNT